MASGSGSRGTTGRVLLLGLDAGSGEVAWKRYLWGQPAVTGQRVYVTTSSLAGARSGHQAGLVALDRRTGRVAWRYRSRPGAWNGDTVIL